MKKAFYALSCFAIAFLVFSCETPTPKVEVQQSQLSLEEELKPSDSLFTVHEGGYDFSILLPRDLMIQDDTEIHFNDATGDLHIQIGNRFWLIVSQEEGSIAQVKEEIQEDMLFKNVIIEETMNSLLYRRVLPDGNTHDYNYCKRVEMADKTYLFRTSEEGEFSKENVDLMVSAVESIRQIA